MRAAYAVSETNPILLTRSEGIKTIYERMRVLFSQKRRRIPGPGRTLSDGSLPIWSLYVNRPRVIETSRTFNFSCMHGHQTHPIDFNSQSYPTLLDGTFVRFDVVKGDPNTPKWSNVLVNKDIRIVGSKEVRISSRYSSG